MERLSNSSSDPPVIKIIIVGDQAVGKTALLLKYTNNTFSDSPISTIGMNFIIKEATVQGQVYSVQIWDSAGQERFRSITRTYYRQASGIMIAYDLTNDCSFGNVAMWVKSIIDEVGSSVPIVLVGTKNDVNRDTIRIMEGEKYAESNGMKFFETSAKAGTNVNDAFEFIINKIVKSKVKLILPRESLQIMEPVKKKKKCC